ncbi:flagellar biosynthesis protein FlgB (plasmid) [Aristophania vespae]|uniref:Flagellar basal body rod protein FlgB n=1 Tax=Aristophania vespae TaxID=2697033 RepID=A0A6P1NLJ9_9PROT|nr:flagellar basal body protein [Aristophania vespae]QHI96502.1 flagellar biosynthesis protein FlgB [Aristophania vespae]UMM64812.1 hypothetical protein DM15PD_18320 [Aristophania vespae]
MSNITNPITQNGSGTDLLHLAERRMSWLQRRESVLAGNVANANTPDYKPKDITSFQDLLSTHHPVTLTRTHPNHLGEGEDTVRSYKTGTLASLNGNQVSLEDELVKIAATNDQHRFATTVYGRYMSMYSMALGSSSST